MAIPASGNPVSILDLAREKVYDNYADARVPYTGGTNKHPKPLDGYAWVTSGNSCTLSSDTGEGIGVAGSGNSALKMVCTGADSYTNSYGDTFNIGTASSGQTWTFSVYAKASVALSGELFIFEAPEDGAHSAFTNTTIAIKTTWARYSVTRTLNESDTAVVRVRVDGPNVSSTDTIYWDGFQVEQAASATNFTMNGPYSLTDLAEGNDDEGSTVDWDAVNTDSTSYPNTATPHAMSEWFNYDHDATGGGGPGGPPGGGGM